MLADSYQQFRKFKKVCANFANRFPRIKKELMTSDADLVLLQEVDHQELYLPFLEQRLGYQVSHVVRRKERDSVIVAYKPAVLELIDEKVIDFDDLAMKG